MQTTLPLLLSVFALPSLPEDDPAPVVTIAAEPAVDTASTTPEALRGRIHEMRMNLLLGGDRVRAAEREAVDFYSGKAELVERRLDTAQAELSEKRATYDLVLARALQANTETGRREALDEAAVLSAEVEELRSESHDLGRKRENLSALVAAVEERERDRDRLVTQLETSSDFDHGFGLPLAGVGLAPAIAVDPPPSPLADEQLVNDLLQRDPIGARRVLFEADPAAYWQRFPLRPPADLLGAALEFPLSDLPGQR